jgi:hypothetical protein
MATMTALDPGRTDDLNKAIELIANKINVMVTQMNTNTTGTATNTSGIALINSALDAIPDPITLTLSTFTEAGVNASLVSLRGQLVSLVAAIKA